MDKIRTESLSQDQITYAHTNETYNLCISAISGALTSPVLEYFLSYFILTIIYIVYKLAPPVPAATFVSNVQIKNILKWAILHHEYRVYLHSSIITFTQVKYVNASFSTVSNYQKETVQSPQRHRIDAVDNSECR